MTHAESTRQIQFRLRMYKFKRAAFWQSQRWGWEMPVIDHWNTTSPIIAAYGELTPWDRAIGYHSMN